MEKIYDRTALPLSSGVLCLKTFFEETKDGVQQYVKNDPTSKTAKIKMQNRTKTILSLMGDRYDSDIFKKLSRACSSDLLRVEGQPPAINISAAKRTPKLLTRAQIPGSTLKTLHKRKEQNRANPQLLRYTSSIWLDHLPPANSDRVNLKPGERLLIVVKIYQPFKHRIGLQLARIPAPSQDIYVLDCNTLAELRDKIMCTSDDVVSTDVSENPSQRETQKARDKYPSGMFYINNKFYIDTRHPESIDYSKVVKEWAKTRNLNVGDTYRMATTSFIELSIRLGYPYVYQHQGGCEHLICFSDVRLLHKSDPLELSTYPVNRCYYRRYLPHCMCCSISLARWVTVKNERLPHDPFFFCEECYMSFNYKNGNKIGDFQAYPYVADEQFAE